MKSNCHRPISPDHVVRSNTHPPRWSSPSLHADIPIPPTLQELKLKPYQGQSWQLHTSRILFVPSTNTKSSQRRRDQRSGPMQGFQFFSANVCLLNNQPKKEATELKMLLWRIKEDQSKNFYRWFQHSTVSYLLSYDIQKRLRCLIPFVQTNVPHILP